MRARPFCYDCHRPLDLCLCASIRPVDNRTEVLVLQHVRERFHPFGSVRLLAAGLQRCQVQVAYRTEGKRVDLPLTVPEGTALVYPRPDARRVDQLTEAERPQALLLLDGTWSQAHRLYRDNPWVQRLPHVSLAPTEPSLYRVRREPKPHCLSTLEAAVHALSALEPELEGLSGLLDVFARMNAQQVARRGESPRTPRRARRRLRPSRAVPEALRGPEGRLVVVYGESSLRHARLRPEDPEPLQWVAIRMETGQCFQHFAAPAHGAPDAVHLRCLSLSERDLAGATGLADLRAAWKAFLRPGDVVAAWNASTLAMHELLAPGVPGVQLKQAYANVRRGAPGVLDEVLAREGLTAPSLALAGRAGVRLGNAYTIARWLREHAQGA